MVELTKTELKWVIGELRGSIKELRSMIDGGDHHLKGIIQLNADNLNSVADKLQKALDGDSKLIKIK